MTVNEPLEPATVPVVFVPSPQSTLAVKLLAGSPVLVSVKLTSAVVPGRAAPSVAAARLIWPASCGTTFAVIVNVSCVSATLPPALASTGASVIVSLNVPAVVAASVTAGAVSAAPDAIPEKAPNPVLVKALAPAIVKLPARASAGAAALFSTPRLTFAAVDIVPRSSV